MQMKICKMVLLIFVLVCAIGLSGCMTDKPYSADETKSTMMVKQYEDMKPDSLRKKRRAK